MLGLIVDAEKEISELERHLGFNPNYWNIAKGELALAHHTSDEGITLLRRGLDGFRQYGSGMYLMGSCSLARALEEKGELAEAAETLQHLSEAKIGAVALYGQDNGSLWIRAQLELARVYRRMGLVDDAEKIEDELRKLLASADEDHVILRELDRTAPERWPLR